MCKQALNMCGCMSTYTYANLYQCAQSYIDMCEYMSINTNKHQMLSFCLIPLSDFICFDICFPFIIHLFLYALCFTPLTTTKKHTQVDASDLKVP